MFHVSEHFTYSYLGPILVNMIQSYYINSDINKLIYIYIYIYRRKLVFRLSSLKLESVTRVYILGESALITPSLLPLLGK